MKENMETLKLTRDDFADVDGVLEYCGKQPLWAGDGVAINLHIDGGLGWISLKAINLNGSLTTEKGTSIYVGGSFDVGGRLDVGEGVDVGWSVEVGWSVDVGEGLKVGAGIRAGQYIRCRSLAAGEQILAGTSVRKRLTREDTLITCEELLRGKIALGELVLLPKSSAEAAT